jgi:hypothetical protein
MLGLHHYVKARFPDRNPPLPLEYASKMGIVLNCLGTHGIAKQILLGASKADFDIDYLKAFIDLARRSSALAIRENNT